MNVGRYLRGDHLHVGTSRITKPKEPKMNHNSERRVIRIDVGQMSLKEACAAVGVKYVPWYKDSFFWMLAMGFAGPSVLTIVSILKG